MVKIMIVDDEVWDRQALKIILKDLSNAEVIAEARNGREAIELDKKFNPDIIIIDIKMPGIDGIKASEIIKKENPKKTIIMITAYDDFELVRKALVLGVNDYVLKPVRPTEILEVIKNAIVNLNINDNAKISSEAIKVNDKVEEVIKVNSPIELVIEYINNNLSENIKLDKMASICNLSACYFSKLFKKEKGVNLISYVNNIKIERAKELLKVTDMPIINIAIDLGFDDCAYFIRVFKKTEGITPKKYREINKN